MTPEEIAIKLSKIADEYVFSDINASVNESVHSFVQRRCTDIFPDYEILDIVVSSREVIVKMYPKHQLIISVTIIKK